MVKVVAKDTKIFYQCEQCGFHYKERETAERCEKWCREHQSCNLEIIKEAVENKNLEIGN